MRRKKNRTYQILEILANEHRIEVSELARQLEVSKVTMRKDLDELESRGIISREHGYAILQSSDDIGPRIAYHYEAKRKIALKACELVHQGDTVMVENGSCCAVLADMLVQTHNDLTIITNSVFIADYIRGKGRAQVILLGGIYQQDNQVLVGPLVRQAVSNFCVNVFFVGTDGFSEKNGFTNRDHLRAEAVRDMAGQAESVVIVTESEHKHALLQRIMLQSGPETSAGAIAFALPVTDTAGMVLRPVSEALEDEGEGETADPAQGGKRPEANA